VTAAIQSVCHKKQSFWENPRPQFTSALAGIKPQQYSPSPEGQIMSRAKPQLWGFEEWFNVQGAGRTFNTGTQEWEW